MWEKGSLLIDWNGCGDRHDLPSRFWEPEPDEEDLKRIEEENLKRLEQEGIDDEPLPFG